MTMNKQDLHDWNSHPVTQKIFKEIDDAAKELSMQSVVRDTVDQTAMQASFNEGMLDGVKILRDTYEDLMEDAE